LGCRSCSMAVEPLPTIDRLRERFGERPFRVVEAVGPGVSRSALYRLRDAGSLVAVGRGVLQVPEGGQGMLSDLAVIAARAPKGVICLNSALAYWDLTDEIPSEIHLAVPRGAHRPSIDRPPTRVHVFDAATFDIERQLARTDVGEPFWIYSPERSVVDAMRLAHLIGRDVALHALGRYVRRGASPARLAELARQLGGGASLRPALEALLS
jgi:predicted transcriptional regulator of viral defense system